MAHQAAIAGGIIPTAENVLLALTHARYTDDYRSHPKAHGVSKFKTRI
jgi:hypothetical protein